MGWLLQGRFLLLILLPLPSAVKVQSPNHWTAKEFPAKSLCFGGTAGVYRVDDLTSAGQVIPD